MTSVTKPLPLASGLASTPEQGLRSLLEPLATYALLFAVAFLTSLWGLSTTGVLWPDDPRYLNAAAMIHDWLFSGEWADPMKFAMNDYAKYPGFSVPYHPPAYPGFLAVWFSFTGISYESARVFVALLFAGGAVAVYTIVRKISASRSCAIWSALLLMLSPEVARWARSTMSEIPALTFALIGTGFFIYWCKNHRVAHLYLAFLFAEIAFFSRVTTAGILPAWFIFLSVSQGWKALKSLHLVILVTVYLGCNVLWVKFVGQYAAFEVNSPAEIYKAVEWFSWDHLSFYLASLPALAGAVTLLAAIAALVIALKSRVSRELFTFGFIWFGCYYAFQLYLAVNEPRLFVFALPGLCMMAAAPLASDVASRGTKIGWQLLLAIAIAVNIATIAHISRGVVGYQPVAARLSTLKEEGNVLLCSWVDQDLIFRYRSLEGGPARSMIRADRTLSIRVADYTRKPSTIVATNAQDVLATVKAGRIRFMVTTTAKQGSADDRDHEMILAHHTATEKADWFELVDQFPLIVDFGSKPRQYTVWLWRYKGELEKGPSTLPVFIPTANMTIQPE